MQKTHGFTIVELLIVIVVIGILAAIAIVAYNGITARSRDAERQSDMSNLKTAVESYYVDNGRYPGCNGTAAVPAACTTDGLSVALTPKYLKSMANDPINIPATNAYWYALGYKKNGPMTHGLTSSAQDYSIGTYMEAKGCPCTGAWGSQVNFMEGN